MATETRLLLTLSYLVPVGFYLLGWSGIGPERSRQAAAQGLLAFASAVLGYFALGFAFHLGGAAVVSDQPGLSGLDGLVGHRVEAGLYWGFAGLEGFFLTGGAGTPQVLILFATYLPMVATAVLLAVLSLCHRAPGWQTALTGLATAAVLLPLVACWAWGGGWLAALGLTLEQGHGFVDFAGSGVVYLLGGMVGLGGLVALGRKPARAGPAEMPPANSPLRAGIGALLMGVGWMGWSLNTPFHAAGAQVDLGRAAVNGMLAMAGATLTCTLTSWLAVGRANPLVVAWGTAAGLVAISAGAPFFPPWAALVVGGIAGLLLPVGRYVLDQRQRLAESTGAVALGVISGLWGLLAVAVFADGRWGQGWNRVGLEEYRTVVGQGVTGFLAEAAFLGDGPGQLIAQVTGLLAVALVGFLGGWLVTKALGAISRGGSDGEKETRRAPRGRL